MTSITFVTACAPYHAHLVPSIRAQVEQQTHPCAHLIIADHERRGPGWARNAGLAQAATPFVTFLDADDLIAETWAAETLDAFERHNGKRYIYTDHVQEDRVIAAPDCAWARGTWHVITALLPTAWALAVGGFDTTLPAFEDTDFYLRLLAHGYRGQRLARPLFHYGPGGQRSARHINTPVYEAAMRYFSRNYRRQQVGGCCGDPHPGDLIATGERLDGDVMVEAAWMGNRPQRGRATGRIYRTGNWKRTWVAPEDADAQPDLWRRVREATAAPDFEFESFADYAQRTGDDGGPVTSLEDIAAFYMQATTPPEGYTPPPVAISVDNVPAAERPSARTLQTKATAGRKRQRRG